MEINKREVQVVEQASLEADAIQLSELDLALVGGGTTDVTFV